MIGEKITTQDINDQHTFNLKDFAKGQYLLEIIDIKNSEQKITKAFTVQ